MALSMAAMASESSDIDTNLSSQRGIIGATLRQTADGSIEIVGIDPGSPAERDESPERLMLGDKIIGVAQGEDGEFVDVRHLPFDEGCQLIRGPKGTTVRLRVIPVFVPDATKVVMLVRDEIKPEEQAAGAVEVGWTDADTEEHWAAIAEMSTWTSTSPRFAEADEAQGEGVLEAFGAQYLPNAYAHYQEVRATAKEREQALKENFPDGRPSDSTRGALYDKVCKATAKAVTEMFRRHDELCHYLLLHRMGAVSDRELAELDATRISIVLSDEYGPPRPCDLTAPVLVPAEIDFASKYLPETHAAFLRLGNAFSEGAKSFEEWRQTALLVDASRSFPLFDALYSRLYVIQEEMSAIVKMVKEQKLLHAVGETTATDLAETDKMMGLSVQELEKKLDVGLGVGKRAREVAELVKQHSTAFIAKKLVESMVKIPGRSFLMGKFEVTQAQWEAVMGDNPSKFKGADNPVENVSWDACQKFVEKLNALPSVQKSGLVFRLPTEDEWEYACRAGATGNYCKLADGTEITGRTSGLVSWDDSNSDHKTHPVGHKAPNAFGLYDILGNVRELTESALQEDYSCKRIGFTLRGGCWIDSADHKLPEGHFGCDGFRLAADNRVREESRQAAIKKVVPELISGMVPIPGTDYRMGKTEVSQAQWMVVMGENPSYFRGSNNPVECVSWNDCQMFLKKLNALPAVKVSGLIFRLPTEKEWEYACRAGATGDYCRLADGTEITKDTIGRVAWFSDNAGKQTHPVGQKKPNAFGLYDMHGNVLEWTKLHFTSDCTLRGGAWGDSAEACESSNDAGREIPHGLRHAGAGFRLCAEKR